MTRQDSQLLISHRRNREVWKVHSMERISLPFLGNYHFKHIDLWMNKSSKITTDSPNDQNASQSSTVIYSLCEFYNTYSAGGIFALNERISSRMLVTFYPIKWGQGTGELEEDFSTKPGRKRGCILGLAEIQSCSKSSQDTWIRAYFGHFSQL